MNRLRHPVYGLCLVLVSAGLLLAHPHFNKTLVVKLPGGAEATLIYNTVPANETHAKKAAVGSFVTPRQPKLRLSAEVKAGAVTIPARVEPDTGVAAVIALLHMSTQRRSPALLNRRHDAALAGRERRPRLQTIGLSVAAEDLRHVDRGAIHDAHSATR